MTSVNLLASLQQVQSMLSTMYPTGGSAAADTSDSSTIASFEQILAALSPSGSTAGGILGAGMTSATGAATGATTTASSGPTGADVVADAKKYLGIPYVLDGESTKGMDCSGLVQQTYKDLGITLGRGVHEQMTEGTAVPSLAQAQPGDLIVFKGGGHVAIYEGNDTVIHAPMPGRYVQNEKLWVGDSGIETIRRIVPSAGTSSSPTTTPTTATTSTAPASTPTSAAVQAAALSAVQAIIQADFGLLSSSQSSTSSLSGSGSSTSSQLSSAIASLENISGGTGSTTTATSSTTSAQQTLAMEQSMLAQEEL